MKLPDGSAARRTLLFALIPVIGVASPIVGIPAITSNFGAAGWAAIAIGQSVGSAAVVIGELGWGLTGPQTVARAKPSELSSIYTVASSTKLLAAAVISPFVFIISYFLADTHRIASGVSAIASCWLCLSAAWFMVGQSRPGAALAVDAIPRVLGVLVGSISLYLGAPLVVFPTAQALACLCSPALGLLFVPSASIVRWKDVASRSALATLRNQTTALSARAASSIYIALPTALISLIGSSDLIAHFAAVDRLVRIVLAGMIFLPLSMQASVGQARNDDLKKVLYSRILVNSFFGLSAATFAVVTFPFLSSLLFSGSVQISTAAAMLGGAVIVITATSRATGSLGLVRVDKISQILKSALAGAAVTLCSIFPLTYFFGSIGALWCIVATEFTVLIWQTVVLVRRVPVVAAKSDEPHDFARMREADVDIAKPTSAIRKRGAP